MAEPTTNTNKENSTPTKTRQRPQMPSIDDFNLFKPISKGAFGKVYLAFKPPIRKQLYAIKVMNKQAMRIKNMAERVTTERNVMAFANSPYVVHIFYSFATEDYVFLVMEYLIGGDIKSLLQIYGYLDEEIAVYYLAQLIEAVMYLHSHGIIHRDLKPDNMLLNDKGHLKLTDFGLSKISFEDVSEEDIKSVPEGVPQRTPGQIASLSSSLRMREQIFNFNDDSAHKFSTPNEPFRGLTDLQNRPIQILTAPRKKCGTHESIGKTPQRPSEPRLSKPKNLKFLRDSFAETARNSLTDERMIGEKGFGLSMDGSDNRMSSPNVPDDETGDKKPHSSFICSSDVIFENLQVDLLPRCNSTPLLAKQRRVFTHRQISFDLSNDKSENRLSLLEDGSLPSESDDWLHDKEPSPILLDAAKEIGEPVRVEPAEQSPSPNRRRSRKRKLSEAEEDHRHPIGSKRSCNSVSMRTVGSLYCTRLHTGDIGSSSILSSTFNIPTEEVRKIQDVDNNINGEEIDDPHPEPEKSDGRKLVCGISPIAEHKCDASVLDEAPRTSPSNKQPESFIEQLRRMQVVESDWTRVSYLHDSDSKSTTRQQVSFRSPKAARRGKLSTVEAQILGTADYLAPELITQQPHDCKVDWWSLGVCMYEFFVGIPPFNDDTVELVFQHIERKEMTYPSGENSIPTCAKFAIEQLLNLDPTKRPTGNELKNYAVFSGIKWNNLLMQPAPFVPQPDDSIDTVYFQARNYVQRLDLSSFHK